MWCNGAQWCLIHRSCSCMKLFNKGKLIVIVPSGRNSVAALHVDSVMKSSELCGCWACRLCNKVFATLKKT